MWLLAGVSLDYVAHTQTKMPENIPGINAKLFKHRILENKATAETWVALSWAASLIARANIIRCTCEQS